MGKVGYTTGGSPIFFGLSDRKKKSRGDKNTRISCQCGNKTTKNQAKKNGGVCFSCKYPLKGHQHDK